MLQRIVSCAVLVAGVALALSACGGGGGGSSLPKTTPTPTPTRTPVPTPTPAITPPALTPAFTTVTSGLSPGAEPYSLAAVRNQIWFTDRGTTNAIGFFTAVAGAQIQEFAVTPGSDPFEMTYDPAGQHLWFTELSGLHLDEVDPLAHQVIGRYNLGLTSEEPRSIAVASDGKLWIAVGTWKPSYNGQEEAVIVFDPATKAVVHRYPLGPNSFDPWAETFDKSGNLWIAERQASQVEEMSASGQILQTIPIPSVRYKASNPFTLAQGPDGNIWVGDFTQFAIWKITPGNSAPPQPYFLDSGCQPVSILPASPTSLWFTDYNCSGIGVITITGAIAEWKGPATKGAPDRMVVTPNGTIWYEDGSTHQIVQMVP